MNNLGEVLDLARMGMRIFPLKPRDKKPEISDWPELASDQEEQIEKWATRFPACNWGLATGAGSGVFVMDFDGPEGMATFQSWATEYGSEFTETLAVRTGKGLHLWFQYPQDGVEIRNGTRVAPGLDIRGEGGFVVVPPSIHPSGTPYAWVDRVMPIGEAPDAAIKVARKKEKSNGAAKAGRGNGHGERVPEGQRNAALASLAGSMRRKGMDAEGILAALRVHNARHCEPPLPEAEVEAIAASVASYQPATTPAVWTEDGLTLKFSAASPDLRYVARWGKWMRDHGWVWREDDVLSVFDRARGICREASEDAGKDTKYLLAAKTRAAIENMARSDPRHAATSDQWDRDLKLLNTPDGTEELRTGELREHRASDYLTKSTAVSPLVGDCPLWNAFLEKITAGDVELQRYLQQVAGYCLTGEITEHVFFFLWGTGANGKGVFTSTLLGILADYGQVAQMEVFVENKNDRHPTELAALRGARLVVASEIDAGRRLAEGRIKTLTGGDRIRARFCRQDEFEFSPQFKLMLAGNHKPALRSVDEAIRRRVHLVPFTVTIPPEERDLNLAQKLKAEWPQILQWAINGCTAWQSQGLNPPAAVRNATEEYLAMEDAILTWLDDRCIVSPQAGTTRTSVLYADFKAWAERTGEFCGSQKRFSQDLQDRGFVIRESHVKVIDGIALRSEEWS